MFLHPSVCLCLDLPSFKGHNKGAAVYVESTTTVRNLLFYVGTLWLNFYWLVAHAKFKTYSCLCTVKAKNGNKNIKKDFAKLHNQIPFLTMLKIRVFVWPRGNRKSGASNLEKNKKEKRVLLDPVRPIVLHDSPIFSRSRLPFCILKIRLPTEHNIS